MSTFFLKNIFFFLFGIFVASSLGTSTLLGERSQCERSSERASERASSRVTQSPSIHGTETRDGHCDHLSFIELHNLLVEFVISIVTYESLALRC